MTPAIAIAAREFRSLFRLPVGWVVIALYLLLTGVFFSTQTLVPGSPSTMRLFFELAGWLILPVAPAISMRLVSDELRSGTIESLMTAPVRDVAVVAGKYAGALLFLLAMLAPTLIYVAVLAWASDPAPEPGPILAGYLFLVLLGATYLAFGTVVSAATSNQTLAYLGTFLGLLAVLVGSRLALAVPGLPASLRAAMESILPDRRAADFAKGVIDSAHVVFFVTVSAWLVSIAVVLFQSRRWR